MPENIISIQGTDPEGNPLDPEKVKVLQKWCDEKSIGVVLMLMPVFHESDSLESLSDDEAEVLMTIQAKNATKTITLPPIKYDREVLREYMTAAFEAALEDALEKGFGPRPKNPFGKEGIITLEKDLPGDEGKGCSCKN